MLEFYTDGAFSAKREKGGVGLVVVKNDEVVYKWSKCLENTTNNRCELYGVIKALQCVSKNVDSIKIYSDSQYVIYTITKGWQRKKNKDLWLTFDKYLKQANQYCSNIEFIWVKGHSSNKYNNLADTLAVSAYEEM